MRSGKVALSFGDYVKLISFITAKTLLGQVKITLRMNSHEIRFQTSIVMGELKFVHNLNGKVSWVPGK